MSDYQAKCTCGASATTSTYTGAVHWELSHKRDTSNAHSTETHRIEDFSFQEATPKAVA